MKNNKYKLIKVFKGLKENLDKIIGEEVILKFGVELEFYIIGKKPILKKELDLLNSELLIECQKEGIRIDNLEKEEGNNQFEVIFQPTKNPIKLAESVNKVKSILNSLANITFEAKPFENEPGNSMHVHISMCTKDGINLFDKNPIDKESYFKIFHNVIGGLLQFMSQSMIIFNPFENCYLRLKYPSKDPRHFHYPTNCSWGFNNRTCAIRIPSTFSERYFDSRIEHRVSSSSSDPFLVFICLIYSINFGIENQTECPEPIYGRAFEYEYDYIEELPRTIKKAKEKYQDSLIQELIES